ncbi:orotidine-5'-phosphate decarboxylase [Legionella sp. W05-934-2]|jgi:orotidine-5'-phosphate decarboxylase|uniref:orotidine-5'-phosphate decarboxylase n=1 Tax=Legionella sp. W05-934-2 TaxID=1198649 RepID=UPI003462F510
MEKSIIVALDYASQVEALALIDQLDATRCRLKVGKEMFTRFGPDFVKLLVNRQFDVFLDLKFHDIPNTVAKACQSAADLGVWMVNVHASGGPAMLDAARQSLESYGTKRPLLIAVTVLTSFDQQQLHQIGIEHSIEQQVLLLADLASKAGCDGVVASALEASAIKQNTPSLLTVTPGIRLSDSSLDDQKRVMTPAKARKGGSDFLVIGRPITQAKNPMSVLQAIEKELESVFL